MSRDKSWIPIDSLNKDGGFVVIEAGQDDLCKCKDEAWIIKEILDVLASKKICVKDALTILDDSKKALLGCTILNAEYTAYP